MANHVGSYKVIKQKRRLLTKMRVIRKLQNMLTLNPTTKNKMGTMVMITRKNQLRKNRVSSQVSSES